MINEITYKNSGYLENITNIYVLENSLQKSIYSTKDVELNNTVYTQNDIVLGNNGISLSNMNITFGQIFSSNISFSYLPNDLPVVFNVTNSIFSVVNNSLVSTTTFYNQSHYEITVNANKGNKSYSKQFNLSLHIPSQPSVFTLNNFNLTYGQIYSSPISFNDSLGNQNLSYTVSNSNFSISNSILSSNLSVYNSTQYNVTVGVSNSLGVSYSKQFNLSLHIPTETFYVDDNMYLQGAIIDTYIIFNDNLGNNGLVYSIVADNSGLFQIGPNNGYLSTTQTLSASSYGIRVKVTNSLNISYEKDIILTQISQGGLAPA